MELKALMIKFLPDLEEGQIFFQMITDPGPTFEMKFVGNRKISYRVSGGKSYPWSNMPLDNVLSFKVREIKARRSVIGKNILKVYVE